MRQKETSTTLSERVEKRREMRKPRLVIYGKGLLDRSNRITTKIVTKVFQETKEVATTVS